MNQNSKFSTHNLAIFNKSQDNKPYQINSQYSITKTSPQEECPSGGNHHLVIQEQKGEQVCDKCGLVFTEKMINVQNSTLRFFSSEEKKNKSIRGSPIKPLTPDIKLTTYIDKKGNIPSNLRRALRWDSRYSWQIRNYLQATSEIKRIGNLIDLPNHVMDSAFNLYKRAYRHDLLKGHSINAMVTAVLYYWCIKEDVPRLLQDILKVTDVSERQFINSYQTLMQELNLKSPRLNPKILVSRTISTLKLDIQIERSARKILKLYMKYHHYSGKDPKGIVAAALYLATNLGKRKITQKRIANALEITPVTLRNRLNEMKKLIRRKKRAQKKL